ncbi:cora-like Mg2+ transporter protein-domain-containing protein [Armillaria fumosa]|nr:cora-like Mg2+ transporter protein-domain-containing protein [Armillaria fumosa]
MSPHHQYMRPASHDFVLRSPPSSHRHSGPSVPWPWIDLNDKVDGGLLKSGAPPIPAPCNHVHCNGCWKDYPRSRFPNWGDSQVQRSGICDAINKYNHDVPCMIYRLDIDNRGYFMDSGNYEVTEQTKGAFWERLIEHNRPINPRVRALFVENMSGPVLQMLGTTYNIEPFFFSSSLSWIPSRFQEEVQPGRGDHRPVSIIILATRHYLVYVPFLGNNCSLVIDLLAVHLIRNVEGNILISYHDSDCEATSAFYLHERMHSAGQSVYWQNIFQRSPDPTFVLLIFIWYAICAWDEAFEALYVHIRSLESDALNTSDTDITHEMHIIRGNCIQFSSLLENLRKTVVFIRDTPNPAMDTLPQEEKQYSRTLLEKECRTLLSEIDRLEMGGRMQDQRLKNALNLVFSNAAVRDSAAMKQIAYLTMIFLPSAFVATAFGMNVRELTGGEETEGTLTHYFAAAVPLTLLTIWVVMTFQSKHLFASGSTFWMRLVWPWILFKQVFMKREIGEASIPSDSMV